MAKNYNNFTKEDAKKRVKYIDYIMGAYSYNINKASELLYLMLCIPNRKACFDILDNWHFDFEIRTYFEFLTEKENLTRDYDLNKKQYVQLNLFE